MLRCSDEETQPSAKITRLTIMSQSPPSPHLDDLAARFERDVIPLRDQLFRAARRYSQSHADAEDLVQETMIKAYVGFGSFKEGTNLRAWLFTIMNHTRINHYRTAKRRPAEWLAGDVSDFLIPAGPRSRPRDDCRPRRRCSIRSATRRFARHSTATRIAAAGRLLRRC